MLNIGGAELIVILLAALIFLGPEKLPGAARQVGQFVNSLRALAQGFQTELEAAARPDPLTSSAPSSPAAQERLAEAARSVDVDGEAEAADQAPAGDDGPADLTAPVASNDEEE